MITINLQWLATIPILLSLYFCYNCLRLIAASNFLTNEITWVAGPMLIVNFGKTLFLLALSWLIWRAFRV